MTPTAGLVTDVCHQGGVVQRTDSNILDELAQNGKSYFAVMKFLTTMSAGLLPNITNEESCIKD